MANNQGEVLRNEEILGAMLESQCTKENFLAKGTFSVYKVKYDDNDAAVKKIPSFELFSDIMNREWELQEQLDHENILKLLHVTQYEDNTYMKCV